MSRYSLEEEEQLASLKAFWAKYGNLILTVLIIVFGSFAAFNGWKWWQARQSTQAVVVYDQLNKALAERNLDLVAQVQNTLRSDFARSTYAERGAMLAARAFIDAGEPEKAIDQLQWAVSNASLDEYAATAKLLLSGLYIQAENFDQAKLVLAKSHPGFEGLFRDRLGDIAQLQGDTATAKTEYQAALALLQADSPWRQVVERKINALPKSGE